MRERLYQCEHCGSKKQSRGREEDHFTIREHTVKEKNEAGKRVVTCPVAVRKRTGNIKALQIRNKQGPDQRETPSLGQSSL